MHRHQNCQRKRGRSSHKTQTKLTTQDKQKTTTRKDNPKGTTQQATLTDTRKTKHNKKDQLPKRQRETTELTKQKEKSKQRTSTHKATDEEQKTTTKYFNKADARCMSITITSIPTHAPRVAIEVDCKPHCTTIALSRLCRTSNSRTVPDCFSGNQWTEPLATPQR